MGIDPKTLRPGDIVLVRGVFEIGVVRVGGSWRSFECVKIVHVEPRPIEVGDTVKPAYGAAIYKVIAVHDGEAWLASRFGTTLAPLANLRHAPHDTSTGEG